MKNWRRIVVLTIPALLMACASGPKLAELSSSIPGLKNDEARIYIYRTNSMLGAAIQPKVMLNGKAVGDSKPAGFFFVDVAPGGVEVTTTSEVEKKLSFTIAAGQTRYVRTSVGLGILVYRIYPELVGEVEGVNEIADSSYIGLALPRR